MMNLTGQHSIAGNPSGESSDTFQAQNPATGEMLPTVFHEATASEINAAVDAAVSAFDAYRNKLAETRADFLEAIAEETLAMGDDFLEQTSSETGYPLARCSAERDRAVAHTRQFAELLREGSWADARIDTGDLSREPFPKPDVRSLMQPVGPVAIFGASNFPIAISVLGADTMSALASGCPVVIKAHPAHPGTCEMAAQAVLAAATRAGIPAGVFSLLQGAGHEVGTLLVEHPGIEAAAFTGSLAGGRALFDVANRRPVPIPFYAEMGSINPLFVLPGALRKRSESLATGFVAALTQGVGQFCTNPGLVVGLEGEEWNNFSEFTAREVKSTSPATMLHAGIHGTYEKGLEARKESSSVELLAASESEAQPEKLEAAAHVFRTTQQGLVEDPTLLNELFGPVSTLVSCGSPEEIVAIADKVEGSLSATIHGTEEDLREHRDLISLLQKKTGRLIFNGFPVGLEVCHSIHHGGPYPAASHSHFTSVGTRGIDRFVRPVCYQDWPDDLLPVELQSANPSGVMRLLNGERTRDEVG